MVASPSLRLIWLKSGPLHPLDTGGKIRSFNMLRILKRRHHVTFVALAPAEVSSQVKESAGEYSQQQCWIPWTEPRKGSPRFLAVLALNQLSSRLPYVIQKYSSPPMTDVIRGLDKNGERDLIVCDFLTPAVNLFRGPAQFRTPTLLFQHNVESLIWKRLCMTAPDPVRRAYLRSQWRRMEKFERGACARFDGVAGVSAEDCEIMRRDFGAANALGAVPTGVDCQYFSPPQTRRKPLSLVFPGSMDWLPNIDGAVFLATEILPRIRRRFPQAELSVVGRNPTAKVRELARLPGLRITGTVNDMRPYLAEAAVMVVPLRVGGGTRIKIFEGMATGIPVVSTRIGAEGLPVTDGRDVLLAEAPEDFAAQVVSLFENPDLGARIGACGRELVESRFSWETAVEVFENYCHQSRVAGTTRISRCSQSGL